MDILSLSDLFLEDLMKSMDIRDRLRLRLTCRTFEKLVAATDICHTIPNGRIRRDMRDGTLEVSIGTSTFRRILRTEEGVNQFLRVLDRLFKKVTIKMLLIEFEGCSFHLDFCLELTKKFKIETLDISDVMCREHLDNFLRLMSQFPQGWHDLHVGFLPDTQQLLSLPPLQMLQILHDTTHLLSSAVFFELLDSHRNVDLMNVVLTTDEWKRTMRKISASAISRAVRVHVLGTTFRDWMEDCGITEHSSGRVGDFEIELDDDEDVYAFKITYGGCFASIHLLDRWEHLPVSFFPVTVEMQNKL